MWRSVNDFEFWRDINEFASRFILWVTEEDSKRDTGEVNPLIPIFGRKDVIVASGGGQTATLPDDRAVFTIALHHEFENVT